VCKKRLVRKHKSDRRKTPHRLTNEANLFRLTTKFKTHKQKNNKIKARLPLQIVVSPPHSLSPPLSPSSVAHFSASVVNQ
jgi:hypothetical protein